MLPCKERKIKPNNVLTQNERERDGVEDNQEKCLLAAHSAVPEAPVTITQNTIWPNLLMENTPEGAPSWEKLSLKLALRRVISRPIYARSHTNFSVWDSDKVQCDAGLAVYRLLPMGEISDRSARFQEQLRAAT